MTKKFGIKGNVEMSIINTETGESLGKWNIEPCDISMERHSNKIDYNKVVKTIEKERKRLSQFEQLKKNILSLDWSMDDAPYFGISGDQIKTIRYAIQRILDGTGLTTDELLKESEEKDWFK